MKMKPEEVDPREVLDMAPALVCGGRAEGGIDYFNRRWLEELGASREALGGWGWTSLIHPDDLEEHHRRWRTAIATGEPAVSESRVRLANGEYRWMLHRIQPVKDELGKTARWFASSVDIEESRHAGEELRKTERELRTILETIPAFVWTARPDGAVDFMTDAWFEWIGHPKEIVYGWEWAKQVHPEDRERLVETWRHALAAGCPVDEELRVPDRHGNYRWLQTRAVPLKTEK